MKPTLAKPRFYFRACPKCVTGAIRMNAIPYEDQEELVCIACGWRQETVHGLFQRTRYSEHVEVLDGAGLRR